MTSRLAERGQPPRESSGKGRTSSTSKNERAAQRRQGEQLSCQAQLLPKRAAGERHRCDADFGIPSSISEPFRFGSRSGISKRGGENRGTAARSHSIRRAREHEARPLALHERRSATSSPLHCRARNAYQSNIKDLSVRQLATVARGRGNARQCGSAA